MIDFGLIFIFSSFQQNLAGASLAFFLPFQGERNKNYIRFFLFSRGVIVVLDAVNVFLSFEAERKIPSEVNVLYVLYFNIAMTVLDLLASMVEFAVGASKLATV